MRNVINPNVAEHPEADYERQTARLGVTRNQQLLMNRKSGLCPEPDPSEAWNMYIYPPSLGPFGTTINNINSCVRARGLVKRAIETKTGKHSKIRRYYRIYHTFRTHTEPIVPRKKKKEHAELTHTSPHRGVRLRMARVLVVRVFWRAYMLCCSEVLRGAQLYTD